MSSTGIEEPRRRRPRRYRGVPSAIPIAVTRGSVMAALSTSATGPVTSPQRREAGTLSDYIGTRIGLLLLFHARPLDAG